MSCLGILQFTALRLLWLGGPFLCSAPVTATCTQGKSAWDASRIQARKGKQWLSRQDLLQAATSSSHHGCLRIGVVHGSQGGNLSTILTEVPHYLKLGQIYLLALPSIPGNRRTIASLGERGIPPSTLC